MLIRALPSIYLSFGTLGRAGARPYRTAAFKGFFSLFKDSL
jgi:hypothetical protein